MKKSFTLIEILVIIVVIGILSAFILVGMSSISQKANFAKGQAFFNSMDNSLLLARVSQWKLDQVGSGPFTTPDSWGTNTGTLMDVDGNCSTTKCPQLVTSGCPSGNCLSFDGVNDYVNCGNGASLNNINTITITAWINPIEDKLEAIVMDSVGGGASGGVPIEFYRQVGGSLRFVSYYNNIPGTITHAAGGNIPLNNWSFVAATFDKNLALAAGKVYINGIMVNSGNDQTPLPVLEQIRTIGSYGGGGWFFNGSIDDVRVYNQAIPTSQIQQSYYLGLNKLVKNNGITSIEYNQRIAELKNHSAKQ